MPDREKVVKGIQCRLDLKCNECPYTSDDDVCDDCDSLFRDVLKLLKEQEEKPLRCEKCSYHREDGWCSEHKQYVKETDYCSLGAWEGR